MALSSGQSKRDFYNRCMIDKTQASVATAVADVPDGATVMIGGFGGAGMPVALVDGLIVQGARDLTIVANNAGNGETGIAALLKAGRVRKVICSFPRQADSYVFDALYRAGKVELELVPQGNLAERIRAAGAGIGGFFTRVGYGTPLAAGKEVTVLYAIPLDKLGMNSAGTYRLGVRLEPHRRSDREIGEALHISPRTASGHVAHLLAKLDVPSRTAAATYAMRRQLVDPPVELPTA